MNKIIYILGHGHSGSTILELLLSRNSREIVSLGEIIQLLKTDDLKKLDNIYKTVYCACGYKMKDCDYWKKFYYLIKNHIKSPLHEKYLIHYDYFKKYYGQNKMFIDNSKNLKYLNIIYNIKEIHENLFVIYLLRDVRSWLISIKRHNLFKNNITALLFWYIKNLKMKKFIINNIKNFFQIGYEELIFFPEYILKKIFESINISGENFNYNMNKNIISHSILSNRLRSDKNKKQQLFYDYRWLYDNSVNYLLTFFPFILKFNAEETYSNRILERKFEY